MEYLSLVFFFFVIDGTLCTTDALFFSGLLGLLMRSMYKVNGSLFWNEVWYFAYEKQSSSSIIIFAFHFFFHYLCISFTYLLHIKVPSSPRVRLSILIQLNKMKFFIGGYYCISAFKSNFTRHIFHKSYRAVRNCRNSNFAENVTIHNLLVCEQHWSQMRTLPTLNVKPITRCMLFFFFFFVI